MGSISTTPCWEAPKFSFNSPNQVYAWKSFYTRALDFLEALDIDPNVEDQGKMGWRQIKMLFKDEVCQSLLTFINNHTVSPEAQQTPSLALKAIQSIIKEDVHFWHHRDELLSDLHRLHNEGIHPLSTCIITLVGKCKFQSQEIKEMMKLMVLQHEVKYHEVREWIHLQDQHALTYQSFLNYCTHPEARCKQYQQAQEQGRAQLTTITAASATPSSLHANIQSTTTNVNCKRCRYTHPCTNCPTFNHGCYNYHNKGHFTALYRMPRTNRCPTNASHRSSSRGRSTRSTMRSSSRRCNRSLSIARQPHRRSLSSHRGSSNSRSPSQDCHNRRSPRCSRPSPTPYRHQVSDLTSSIYHSEANEGQLYTDMAPDGH